MEIYVVRHGETLLNAKGITQGRQNNRLSSNGKRQAQTAAELLKDVNISYIFCSPLCRTVQTANIINQYHNVKTIKDDRLNEIDQGIYTGKKYDSLTEEQKERKKLRLKEDGVESYEEVFARAKGFIQELKQNNKNETILIVSHNITASCIESILTIIDCDYSKIPDFKLFKNSQVKRFVVE